MREQLRSMLIAVKIMQLCTDIFAVFGVFLFSYIYFKQYSDNPASAIKDPYIVIYVLIPFLPAAMLAYMTARQRKKIRTLVEQIANTLGEKTTDA